MTKEECEKRVEDMLYSLPGHCTTMDRFTCDYENYFKEKLTSYCGHSKLLLLLQEMKATVAVSLLVATIRIDNVCNTIQQI